MVEISTIRVLSQQIAALFKPEKIVLFGSYAYGAPSADSDVDLLVVLPFEGRNPEKATEIWMATRPKYPVDLLVRKPAEIQARLAMGDPFIAEILAKGIILYEAAYA
ncbi:MAG: nucleotidyltransferase domain-containing protein [Chloroflexi bacterium]|nr:nucleotidyltransferase domain-containing protein [Chloroflexota bacterium]